MGVTYIVDSISGCQISDYTNICIISSVSYAQFGCDSVYGRIWHAGFNPDLDHSNNLDVDIRLVQSL